MCNKRFSYKLRSIIALMLALTMSIGSLPAFANDKLAALQAQHDANSAAWHIAHDAYKAAIAAGDEEAAASAAATKAALEAANAAIRVQMDALAEVDYDETTGVTTVTTPEGSTTNEGTGFTGNYDSGKGAYSDESLDAYMNAGTNAGVSEDELHQNLVNGYNQTGKEDVDAGHPNGCSTNAAPEVAVIKEVQDLSDAEAEALLKGINDAKEQYKKAMEDLATAIENGDADAEKKARDARDEAHAAAEALRDPYGYSGDGYRIADKDGGFVTWEPDGGNNDSGSGNDIPDIFDVSDIIDQIEKDYENAHVITVTVGAGGTVSPARDSYGNVYVADGRKQTFTIKPNSGYIVDRVEVDGVNVGTVLSYTFDFTKSNAGVGSNTGSTSETTTETKSGSLTFDSSENAQAWIDAYRKGDRNTADSILVTHGEVTTGATDFYDSLWENISSIESVDDNSPAARYEITEDSSVDAMKEAWFEAQADGDTEAMDAISAMIEAKETPSASSEADINSYSNSAAKVGIETVEATVNLTIITENTTVSENTKTYHTLYVTFKQGQSYTITASSGAGGSISPSGSVSVAQGSNQTFTITPDSGYGIKAVIVDGVDQGAKTSYTFSNVTKAHTIKAEFKSLSKIDIGGLELEDSNGADLNGISIKSGYGFFIRNLGLDAQHVKNLKVTFTYNFGQGNKSVTLEQVGGKWEFPVNADSPLSRRCIYIPVETKDNTYTVTVEAVGIGADGTTIKDTATATITVKGSMYEDDFTGDS